jgi:hypothetical protein
MPIKHPVQREAITTGGAKSAAHEDVVAIELKPVTRVISVVLASKNLLIVDPCR